LILLDEVSSGLNETETEAMADVLRSLAADGIGILLVEHDMSLVMSTCEVIHVLDFGEIIAMGGPAEIQADPRFTMTDMRHVVVHVEVAAAVSIEQPDTLSAHQVHRVAVKQAVRRPQ
jgi:energy-coupling factor transporter ATP-binding protein EcfA2